jgi:hypothetical protein
MGWFQYLGRIQLETDSVLLKTIHDWQMRKESFLKLVLYLLKVKLESSMWIGWKTTIDKFVWIPKSVWTIVDQRKAKVNEQEDVLDITNKADSNA